MIATQKKALPDERVDVVVARGNSVIDNTGAQILAGQTAKVLASEVQHLIECGAIVDPTDRAGERTARRDGEADRLAWNLHVGAQNAAAVAIALRPNRPGGEQRALQLAALAAEIESGARRLLAQITGGETGQPATVPAPLIRAAEPTPTKEN